VQPLQRAALTRQRLEQSFDASQTRYIGDLTMALRARLDCLNSGLDVGLSVKAVEQKLDWFLESVQPGNEESNAGEGSVNSQESSLEEVFAEEAREILDGLHDVVMTESFCQASAEKSLGLLHTLKGSARMVGKTEIAQVVHELESEVKGLSDISAQHDRIRSGYQAIQSQLQRAFDEKLLSASTDTTVQTPTLPENNAGGLQVSDTAFDSLLSLATDLTVNHASLSEELAAIREAYQVMGATVKHWQTLPKSFGRPEYNDLAEMMADLDAARLAMRTALRQAEREQQKVSRTSASLQQSLIRTRLVRVDELHDRLTRTVQDACAVSGVSANLVFEGGELTLDRALFKQLAAPLDHIVRNAVVHGIEPAEQRVSAGKSPVGKLTLNASVDGTDLIIRFFDDGRGIDRESLNALAVKRGQGTVETHEEMQRLLFSSGFSSVETANELAGHGLGLAAVKTVAEQLGGRVLLSTEAGAGTIVTLRLPQRMVINQVVLVDCDGLLYAIPVGYIVSVLVEGSENVSSDEFAAATIDFLLASSSQQRQQSSDGPMATVLVKVRGKQLAVQVDQVIGYRELVTQPLGPQMSSLNQFIGGSVLPDGRQVLILDLVKLLDSPESNSSQSIRPASESLRPVALIVDDSRTMRVAIERVLQQCGIAVRLANDGVEALESVGTALPNLVIVDLEMPRLDGMSLLDQLSSKYGKACPPLIIISSRDDALNRQRAQSLGVVRFLNKPFTESALLEAIEAAGMRIPDLTIA
jgi:chemosensory pili system protein ChpA (sensor histidine kinase/response regulator)